MKIGLFLAGFAVAASLFSLAPTPRYAAAAPDNTLGMAILGALLNADGTLDRGSGVTSTTHFATGGYKVNFDRDISDCTFAATPVGTSAVIRAVSVVGTNLQFNIIRVSDGVAIDTAFSLIVFCPK